MVMVIKRGGGFGLVAALAQLPLLGLGLVAATQPVASSLLFGALEMISLLVISGLVLYLYARIGQITAQQTERIVPGGIGGMIAGMLTGGFIVVWAAVLQHNAFHVYRMLAGKGQPPAGLPVLNGWNIAVFLCGYALVGAIFSFIGAIIGRRAEVQRREDT